MVKDTLVKDTKEQEVHMAKITDPKRAALKEWIDANGGAKVVAARAGLSPSTLYAYCNSRSGSHRMDTVTKIAESFGVEEKTLFNFKNDVMITIIGKVVEGSLVVLNFIDSDKDSLVVAPPYATKSTKALKLSSGVLGNQLKNWIVFYDDLERAEDLEILNQLCVVKIPSGETVVRRVERSEGGQYALTLQGESTILSDHLDWARPIIGMMPPEK